MRRRALVLTCCALAALPGAGLAQGATAWLDGSGSSARPPAGVVGSTTLYGTLGGRVNADARGAGSFDASLLGGLGGGTQPARWLAGDGSWEVGRSGPRVAWGGRLSGLGLRYAQPFAFRAAAAGLEPRLSTSIKPGLLQLRGLIQRGRWSEALPRNLSKRGALRVTGGSLSLARVAGLAWVEGGVEAYRGWGGGYGGVLASAVGSHGPVDLGVSLRGWASPQRRELGFSASAAYPVSDAATLRVELGRSVTDPLFGAPGNFGASVGVSLRVASISAPWRRPAVVELVPGPASAGHRARFRFQAPRARSVALAGDFTAWRPRAMRRTGDEWSLELRLPPGVHHFAFLVDGKDWRLPADAPGATADEWGRRNATIVVDP